MTKIQLKASTSLVSLLIMSAGVTALMPAAASAQALGAGDDTALEEVVVTAQRREERLQDVPAAISAFSGGQLERLGISGTKELTQIAPGFSFTQSVYSPQPTVRGIGTRGVGAGDESVVPVYIDGIYQSFLSAAALEFNNVERIEILKGPQGALYGRNATGGAINIITKTPTATPEGSLSFSYGRFGDMVGKAYISGGTDTLAASLALVASEDGDYIRHIFTGRKMGGGDNITGRTKIVWKPTDNFDLIIGGSYGNSVSGNGQTYYHPEGNTIARRIPGQVIATQPYTTAVTGTPANKLQQWGYSLTGVYRAEKFSVTSLTAFANYKLRVFADADGQFPDLTTQQFLSYSRNLYHETYVTSQNEGMFNWVAGAVYYEDLSGQKAPGNVTRSAAVSTTGVVGAIGVTTQIPQIRTKSYAVYAQGTLQVTDEWSVIMSGRYTQEKKSIHTLAGTLANIFTSPLVIDRQRTFSAFTPALTVKYQPSPTLNIYAKAGQAFKSGIFNSSANTFAAAAPVNPEDVIQYELGFKADPTRWMRLNGAVYHTDYTNLQSSVRRDNASFTENAGKAKIDGVETDATIRPIANLNIRASVSLLKAEYKDFPNATVNNPVLGTNGQPIGGNGTVSLDVSGKRLMRTPFTQWNLGGDYTIPMDSGDVILSGNVGYVGKSYWESANRVEEPSRYMVSARLAWHAPEDRFVVSVYGENLANEKWNVTRSISASGDQAMIAKPRTYGIEVGYNW